MENQRNTPKTRLQLSLILVLFSFFISSLSFGQQLDELKKQYGTAIDEAKTLIENPDRISGFDRFKLAYSSFPANSFDERIGRLLLVLDSQDAVIDSYLKKQANVDLETLKPRNGIVYSLGVKTAEKLMILDAPKDAAGKEEYRKALKDFFAIFDLRDMNGGFSGLPFYSTVENLFKTEKFRRQVLELNQALVETLQKFESNPSHVLQENIFDFAMKATGGSKRDAIELVSILTTRDVLITRYLKYFKHENDEFVKSFAKAPVLIRLISELDQKARGSEVDLFSFPKTLSLVDERNYYYWSSAYTSMRLKEIGYSDDVIARLNKSFPKQYKTLRYLEGMVPFKSAEFKKEFNKETLRTIRMADEGTRLGLAEDLNAVENTKETVEYEKFKRFIGNLEEEKNLKTLQKVEMLDEIAKGDGEAMRNAYLFYYNYESNVIGYPHLKLAMNGKVYEIHRSPNADGSFLRERNLTEALKDARKGYLPSGIIAIPMTTEQMETAIKELQKEADGSMKYAFFNKLFHSDTYNCGGVLYEGLLRAGVPLPKLGRLQVLPGQMFRQVFKSVKAARFVGVGKKWTEDIVKPNWSLDSIPMPLGKKKIGLRKFSGEVGHDFLYAEQVLVRKIPNGADPIHQLGRIIPYYSNTGALPEEFVPTSSPFFDLKTVLIPLEEAEVTKTKLGLSELSQKVSFVEVSGRKYVRFFIHPNELEHYAPLISKHGQVKDPLSFVATTSSSARSLIVKESTGSMNPFMIKLSLSIPMGGANRLLDEERVYRGIVVNDLMAEIEKKSEGNLKFSGKKWQHFSETVSVLPKANPELGGYILRELPAEMKNDIVLPAFSLIAKKKFEERWIEYLFAASGRKDKLEFVYKDLVLPLLELHVELAMKNGITTELHQQNVMYVIDKNTEKVKGLYLRDMDGNWVDHSLRVNQLGMKPVDFKGFEKDAYYLRYAYAGDNHFASYVDMLRNRNIINTYKYFLNEEEMEKLVEKSDAFIVTHFNENFPMAKIKSIEEFKEGVARLAKQVTTKSERELYDSIKSVNSSSKGFSLTKWLQDIHGARVEASVSKEPTIAKKIVNFFTNCSSYLKKAPK